MESVWYVVSTKSTATPGFNRAKPISALISRWILKLTDWTVLMNYALQRLTMVRRWIQAFDKKKRQKDRDKHWRANAGVKQLLLETIGSKSLRWKTGRPKELRLLTYNDEGNKQPFKYIPGPYRSYTHTYVFLIWLPPLLPCYPQIASCELLKYMPETLLFIIWFNLASVHS